MISEATTQRPMHENKKIQNIWFIPLMSEKTNLHETHQKHTHAPGLLKQTGMTDHAASPLLRCVSINNACFLTP